MSEVKAGGFPFICTSNTSVRDFEEYTDRGYQIDLVNPIVVQDGEVKEVDLSDVKNIFVIATIFIAGIGGLAIKFNHFEFSPIACAFVAGVLINVLVNIKPRKKEPEKKEEENQEN